jgi:antitoxin ParD1/3/4
MSGRNFSLTPHLSDFVDQQVASGQHQNASEVVREALRRYEADMVFAEAQLREIMAVAERGRADIEQGRYVTISTPEDEAALRRRVRARASEMLAAKP